MFMLPNPSVAVLALKSEHTQTHPRTYTKTLAYTGCAGPEQGSGKHGLWRRPTLISVPPPGHALGHASYMHWDACVRLDQHSRQKATCPFQVSIRECHSEGMKGYVSGCYNWLAWLCLAGAIIHTAFNYHEVE